MEENVIDDADKSVKQQANECCENPLLKRGQGGIKCHVSTGTGCLPGGREYICVLVYITYGFGKRNAPIHIRQSQIIVNRDWQVVKVVS